jgi:hypothetical protein
LDLVSLIYQNNDFIWHLFFILIRYLNDLVYFVEF